MIRILFLLAALAFLVVAVMSLVQGDGTDALRAAGIVLVCSVFSIVADRWGEGMSDTPPPSRP
jgi:hypothetical protein